MRTLVYYLKIRSTTPATLAMTHSQTARNQPRNENLEPEIADTLWVSARIIGK